MHQALSAARASLAEPSRPYTPLDRSLFQQPDESERPSSSYGALETCVRAGTLRSHETKLRGPRPRVFPDGVAFGLSPLSPWGRAGVDQLAFVRDTFGRPESRSGSRHGRVETISEAQVLRLDGSSSGEELTPVVARPARPPRPPQGGYPAASPKATSPKRLSSSSPRRRLASLREPSPQRVPPMPATRRNRGRNRGKINGKQLKIMRIHQISGSKVRFQPRRAADEVAKAPCEVVISKLQAVKASKEPGRRSNAFKSKPLGSFRPSSWPETLAETAKSSLDTLEIMEKNGKSTRNPHPKSHFEDPNLSELSELCERLVVLAEELAAPGAATEHSAELLREVMGLMDLKAFKAPAQLFKLCRCALLLLTLEPAVKGVPVSGVRAACLGGFRRLSEADVFGRGTRTSRRCSSSTPRRRQSACSHGILGGFP